MGDEDEQKARERLRGENPNVRVTKKAEICLILKGLINIFLQLVKKAAPLTGAVGWKYK